MSERKRQGQKLVEDPAAASADPSLPAFLASPPGSPVYHGFPLLAGSEIEGWKFGVITNPSGTEPCEWGDAYVVAPDGSRAGIVWSMQGEDFTVVMKPESGRWGVYGLRFRHEVRCEADLIKNLHEALPKLKAAHAQASA